VGTFLLVVNDDHAGILYGYGDTGLQRFWGHVTIRLGICGFLLVVHWNYAFILHRFGDIKP